eukprot:gene17299-23608_t
MDKYTSPPIVIHLLLCIANVAKRNCQNLAPKLPQIDHKMSKLREHLRNIEEIVDWLSGWAMKCTENADNLGALVDIKGLLHVPVKAAYKFLVEIEVILNGFRYYEFKYPDLLRKHRGGKLPQVTIERRTAYLLDTLDMSFCPPKILVYNNRVFFLSRLLCDTTMHLNEDVEKAAAMTAVNAMIQSCDLDGNAKALIAEFETVYHNRMFTALTGRRSTPST